MICVMGRPDVELRFADSPVISYKDGDTEKTIGATTCMVEDKMIRFMAAKLSSGKLIIFLYDWIHYMERRVMDSGEIDAADKGFFESPKCRGFVRFNDLYVGRYVDELLKHIQE